MKRDDVFPSKYFKGSDLPEPKVVTIEIVKNEVFKNTGKEEVKPVVYFKKTKKALILNRTNWDSISDITGQADTDNWPNHRIELYSKMQEVRSEMKNCVRVRAPEDLLTPKKKPPAPAKQTLAEELDEEVPSFSR
jgi:hypothetical protein